MDWPRARSPARQKRASGCSRWRTFIFPAAWYEARKYCEWLTAQLRGWKGALPAVAAWLERTVRAGWEVTLPSEVQWERAARGTDGQEYPWPGEFDANRANTVETGIGRPSAVGAFPAGASPVGALDMSGNVWEWTRSLWGSDWEKPDFEYPYDPDDHQRENLAANDSIRRVARGGSYFSASDFARAAFRRWLRPDSRNLDIGFRLVVSRSRS